MAPHCHHVAGDGLSIVPPVKGKPSHLRDSLQSWNRKWNGLTIPYLHDNQKSDTWIVPCIQLQCLGIAQDHMYTMRFLNAVQGTLKNYYVTIATGYFNCPEIYCNSLFRIGSRGRTNLLPHAFEVITAAPKANGFFAGHGIVSLVPLA